MKPLLIVCTALFSFFAADAQSTKKHSKKSRNAVVSREALVQAKLDSIETARQLRIDSMIITQYQIDSVRRLNDSLAYLKSQEESIARREARSREIDSMNKAHVKMLSQEREHSVTIQRQREQINKTAKLNDYQRQQVDYINQIFFEKARTITENSAIAGDQKKAQLAKLNEERKDRLKTVIGKSREKKFEKVRKANPNTNDSEVQWINQVDVVAKT